MTAFTKYNCAPEEKRCEKREITKFHNCEIIFRQSLWFICAAEKTLKDISHHKTVPTATSLPLCGV